eukprot:scaffold800_cov111-Isochrysis_galbana.AAC.6
MGHQLELASRMRTAEHLSTRQSLKSAPPAATSFPPRAMPPSRRTTRAGASMSPLSLYADQ